LALLLRELEPNPEGYSAPLAELFIIYRLWTVVTAYAMGKDVGLSLIHI